jgi:hypothetical protein
MPVESQVLYFHMILRADDDGVVESYPLLQLLKTPPDAFKVLLAKQFIKQLNEDQVVVINDWLEHNIIRADRKVDSIYKELLISSAPEVRRIDPKPRSDVEDNSKRLGGQSTDVPRTAYVRLGKVRLGEREIHPFKDFKEKYPRKEDMVKAEAKWNLLSLEEQSLILKDIPARKEGKQWKEGYIPHPTTYINGKRWLDEIIKVESNSTTL